jgi:hypothetical protein
MSGILPLQENHPCEAAEASIATFINKTSTMSGDYLNHLIICHADYLK